MKLCYPDICSRHLSNFMGLSQFFQKCDLGTFRTKPFNSRFSRLRQRRTQDLATEEGHNRGCGGEAGEGGRFSLKKTLILAHFYNEKEHAVNAVTRDNTKIFSQLTVCLKAEAWPK